MSTYNHTAISTGAAADAATFNSPMGQLDNAMGDVSGLLTTAASLTTAINEHDLELGNVGALTTTATNVAAAINEHDAEIGNLASLTTATSASLVAATNELDGEIGNLAGLNTETQSSLVGAINEINDKIATPTLSTVASATTITLSDHDGIVRISGSNTIQTINPKDTSRGWIIYLIAIGAWSLTTGGNIAAAYSPSLNEAVCLVYDNVANQWSRVG